MYSNAIKSTVNGITESFDYKGRYLSYFKSNRNEKNVNKMLKIEIKIIKKQMNI